MGDIYRNAIQCIVIMESINQNWIWMLEVLRWVNQQPFDIAPIFINNMQNFIMHSWWGRVWTLQEMINAKCLKLKFGKILLDMELICLKHLISMN